MKFKPHFKITSLNVPKLLFRKKYKTSIKTFGKSRNIPKMHLNKRIWSMKKPILKVTLSLVLVLSVIFFIFNKIKIGKVECVGPSNVCDEVVAIIGDLEVMPAYKAINKINTVLKSKNNIKSFVLKYKFPSKIVITLSNNEPIIAIRNDGSWIAEVDDEGRVLGLVDNSDLSFIFTDKAIPNIGENLDYNLTYALNLYKSINSLEKIEKAKVIDNNLLLKLQGESINFIFPLSGDVEYLSGSLVLILSRLNNPVKETTIEKSEIAEVDFRYKYPVIRRIKTVDF